MENKFIDKWKMIVIKLKNLGLKSFNGIKI